MTARRILAAALAAALLVPAGAATPAAGAVTTAAGPGALLSAEEFWAPGFELARAWRITYRSTSATGAANTVSGTVLVPRLPYPGPRPVIGYAVGTHGLGDQCAPSRRLASGTEGEAAIIGQYTARGWAVAVTDYEGLGTAGDHTYTAGRSAGHALLDVVRAAQRLTGSRGPAGVTGYSQGGQAAGWAAQLHASYAPDIDLRGSVVGAPPADLEGAARANDGGLGSGLILAAGAGLDAAYPELGLPGYLNAAGVSAVADVRGSCVAEFSVRYAFRRLAEFTTVDVLALPEWRVRLAEQRLGGVTPDAPVLLYHSPADELLPFGFSEKLSRDWRGGELTWWVAPAGGHVPTLVVVNPAAVQWLASAITAG
ncbi:lipase family protein [Longispora albida]|uniref:lipase family protein n=1 Tax=Longispora albida TaxID=203523 RepID=UPI0003A141E1|nr:lipase family protein [Longispora albida]